MTDFLYRQLSGTAFDGTEEIASDGTLYDIDPTQRSLLAWVTSVANNDMGAKGWANAVAHTALDSTSPVEFTLNREPTRNLLKQLGVRYPVLAIWPEQATVEEATLELDRVTTTWSLLYLLGPLNEEDFAKCGAALRIFGKLFTMLIKNRSHGEHEDGALQYDTGEVDVSSIRVRGIQYGTLEKLGDGQDGLAFHAAKIAFETTEIDHSVDGADPDFEGFAVRANSVDPEGSWVAAEGEA